MVRAVTVLGVALVLAIASCSTFHEAPDDTTPSDAGADGILPADGEGGDAAAFDAPSPSEASTGKVCTPFDSTPAMLKDGWKVSEEGPAGGSLMATTNQPSGPAIKASVSAGGQTEDLVRSVTFRDGTALTISVDLSASSAAGSPDSLTNLIVLACENPAMTVALQVTAETTLTVGSEPMGSSALAFAATPKGRFTFTLDIKSSVANVTVDGTAAAPLQLPSSFAPAVGCTLKVGAATVGSPGLTEAYYFDACVE